MCRFCWHTLRRVCYPSPYTLVLERVSGGTVACMRTVRAVMRWASRWTPRAVLDRAWGRWGPRAEEAAAHQKLAELLRDMPAGAGPMAWSTIPRWAQRCAEAQLVIGDLRHIVGDKSVKDADRVAAANALFVWMQWQERREAEAARVVGRSFDARAHARQCETLNRGGL